eukprot:1831090-Pyramimonas_sp.AAC.1
MFRLFAADTCQPTNRMECLDWHAGKMGSYTKEMHLFQVRAKDVTPRCYTKEMHPLQVIFASSHAEVIQ